MKIQIACEVTEYVVMPDKPNVENVFILHENCLVIKFCNNKEELLKQSEISKDNAIKLANAIINFYS